VKRLLLVRHAPTAAACRGAFPVDEPIEAGAELEAARLAERLPAGCEAIASPALRCRQTAGAAGLRPALDPRISECDFGAWAGRTLAEVDAGDAAWWMADPEATPHGGESLAAFFARVAGWLDSVVLGAESLGARSRGGSAPAAVAITHSGVIRAAVVHALCAPVRAVWQLDAAPLAITELHAHDGRWTVHRVNSVS
jgi:broad specificity phosphatase PhoE